MIGNQGFHASCVNAHVASVCFASVVRYAWLCTPLTARPLGSFMPQNDASHANASAVLHATLGTLGTLIAALSLGKWAAKSER